MSTIRARCTSGIELPPGAEQVVGHMRRVHGLVLKSWWGGAATAENDYCFCWLPRIDDDHSRYWTVEQMLQGNVRDTSSSGRTRRSARRTARPNGSRSQSSTGSSCATSSRSRPHRSGTTARRSSPVSSPPSEIGTEVFFLPAATHLEKDGSFTNTQRLLQWHHKAVEPRTTAAPISGSTSTSAGWSRSGSQVSPTRADRAASAPDLGLSDDRRDQEPSAEAVLAEINGWDADGKPLSAYKELKADGSTSCGCWIYCGVFADGVNQAARRKPHWEQGYSAQEWGWAWPANRRLLYNRASADPEGKPWSARKKLVWWDEQAEKWTGTTRRTTTRRSRPATGRPRTPPGPTRSEATTRSSCNPTDAAGSSSRRDSKTGRCRRTTSRTSRLSGTPLYAQRSNPARQRDDDRAEDPYNGPGSDAYPYVVTTYRLTEHHTAGGMTRSVPHLAELQPEMFVRGASGARARARPRARRLGDRQDGALGDRSAGDGHRPHPARCASPGVCVHQVGLPYHWGSNGLTTGDSANDLSHMALDPNVHIQEAKAFTCDIRPGRTRERHRPTRERPQRMGFFTDTSCASGARRARSRARSGTSSPRTGSTGPARATTTPAS